MTDTMLGAPAEVGNLFGVAHSYGHWKLYAGLPRTGGFNLVHLFVLLLLIFGPEADEYQRQRVVLAPPHFTTCRGSTECWYRRDDGASGANNGVDVKDLESGGAEAGRSKDLLLTPW